MPIKRTSSLLCTLLLLLLLHRLGAQEDTLRQVDLPKNRVAIELLGDPLSLNYERLLIQKGNYSLYAGAGFSMPFAVAGFPNISLGLGNSFRLSRKISLFIGHRSQFLSLAFPQVPLGALPGYVPMRNHLGINALSFQVSLGVSFHCGNWEFAPLYPSGIYALGMFADEDAYYSWYKAIALNSRIYYRF